MNHPSPPTFPGTDRPLPWSWFRRYGVWLILSLVVLVVAVGVFVGGIIFFVFSIMRTAEPYQHAMEAARRSPAVVRVLGEPIEQGWYLLGSYDDSGPSGVAEYSIPVHGPSGSGTITVKAAKAKGVWSYSVLQFQAKESEESVPLLPSGSAVNP